MLKEIHPIHYIYPQKNQSDPFCKGIITPNQKLTAEFRKSCKLRKLWRSWEGSEKYEEILVGTFGAFPSSGIFFQIFTTTM
jgi:hypothetical protein